MSKLTKSLVVFVFCLSGSLAYAGTKSDLSKEMLQFKEKVDKMSMKKKVVLGIANHVALIAGCAASAAGTGLSAAADTIPVLSYAANIFLPRNERMKLHLHNYYIEETGGGLLTFFTDLYKMSMDSLDGSINDGSGDEYWKAFQHLRNAYSSTELHAKFNFAEGSVCYDSAKRLEIIFGHHSKEVKVSDSNVCDLNRASKQIRVNSNSGGEDTGVAASTAVTSK